MICAYYRKRPLSRIWEGRETILSCAAVAKPEKSFLRTRSDCVTFLRKKRTEMIDSQSFRIHSNSAFEFGDLEILERIIVCRRIHHGTPRDTDSHVASSCRKTNNDSSDSDVVGSEVRPARKLYPVWLVRTCVYEIRGA